MADINKIIVGGRLTKDVELNQTANGLAVAKFSIASDSGYGEKKSTNFINVVAWRTTAEFISKYFTKGNKILLSGTLQIRQYEDKNQQKRTATEIIADEAFFVDKKESESKKPYVEKEEELGFQVLNLDDNLPF